VPNPRIDNFDEAIRQAKEARQHPDVTKAWVETEIGDHEWEILPDLIPVQRR
jgi:hypothetical protein